MTAARTRFPGGTERLRVAVAAVLFVVCSVALSWPAGDIGPLEISDREQHLRIAFNLARYGEFHDARSLAEIRSEGPYSRREPGFPCTSPRLLHRPPSSRR